MANHIQLKPQAFEDARADLEKKSEAMDTAKETLDTKFAQMKDGAIWDLFSRFAFDDNSAAASKLLSDNQLDARKLNCILKLVKLEFEAADSK